MDKVTDLLTQLADKLGVAVDYIWTSLVKQAYVDGISLLLWGGFWLIIELFIIIIIPKILKSINNKCKDLKELKSRSSWLYSNDEVEGWEAIYWILAILSVCLLIIAIPAGFNCIIGGIKHLYNPDYYAVERILNLVNGAVK